MLLLWYRAILYWDYHYLPGNLAVTTLKCNSASRDDSDWVAAKSVLNAPVGREREIDLELAIKGEMTL